MLSLVVSLIVLAPELPPECQAPATRDVSSLSTFAQASGSLSVGLDSVATWCFGSDGTWTGGQPPPAKGKTLKPGAAPTGDCSKAILSCETARASVAPEQRQVLFDALGDLERPFLGVKYKPKRSGLAERPAEIAECGARDRSALFAHAQARMDLARLASQVQSEYANYKTWLFSEGLKCAQAVARGEKDFLQKRVAIDTPVQSGGTQQVPNGSSGTGPRVATGAPGATGTSGSGASGSGTSGTGASGTGTSGTGTSGTGTSGTGTNNTGTSGSGTSGAGTSGAGTSGTGTSGTGTSGTGTSGTGTSNTGTSGSGTSGAGTSGAGTSGAGTSGGGTSGAGTSGAGTSGAGTSGAATSGTGSRGTTGTATSGSGTGVTATSGTGTSGTGTSGTGMSGTGTSGTGMSGTGMSGTGTSGTGMSGTGTSGTGTSGTGMSGTGMSGTGTSGTGSLGALSVGGPTTEREKALNGSMLEKWRYFFSEQAKIEQDADWVSGFIASRELRDCRCLPRPIPGDILRRLENKDRVAQLEADDDKNTRCEVCLLDAFPRWKARAQKQCSLALELTEFELGVLQRSDDGNGLPPRCVDAALAKQRGGKSSVVVTQPGKPPPGGAYIITKTPEADAGTSSDFVKPSDYAPIPSREEGRVYVRVFTSSACVAEVLPGPVQARTGDLLPVPLSASEITVRGACGGFAEVYFGKEEKPRVSESFARNQPLRLKFRNP